MPAVNLTEAHLGLARLATDSRDWTPLASCKLYKD